MGNEIKISLSITANKGYQNDEFDASGLNVDMTNNGGEFGIQYIGTAAAGELVDLGDLVTISASSLGISAFRNIEAAGGNYVELGVRVSGAFYSVFKLNPGQSCGGCVLGTTTLYARANTATVQLKKFILEA